MQNRFKDKLMELLDVDMSGSDGGFSSEMADYLIANDVVPVVRCKDCKYCKDSIIAKGFKKCAYSSTQEHDVLILPDDFCNYGEKEE